MLVSSHLGRELNDESGANVISTGPMFFLRAQVNACKAEIR